MSSGNITSKVAVITGITGQDGIYLSELLLTKGYEVHGLVRPSTQLPKRELLTTKTNARLFLHYADILNTASLIRVLQSITFNEIYHFAAQSRVDVSYELPGYTTDVNAQGTVRIIEVLNSLGLQRTIRFYNACTSEVFGDTKESPQTEATPFQPLSPYAISKAHAFWAIKNWRASDDVFAVSGISFNHESPLRGSGFVSRKVTISVGLIAAGKMKHFELGNLNAMRDWGHAKDYVHGMYEMLQQHEPNDYVLASGETHSVREFVEESFECIGMKIMWSGKGFDEVGVDMRTAEVRVRVNRGLFRPLEVPYLHGSAAKAYDAFSWRPRTSFRALVAEMVEADVKLAKTGDLDQHTALNIMSVL